MVRVKAKDLIAGAKNSKSMHEFLQGQNPSQVTPQQTPKRKATSPAALQNISEKETNLREICKGINAINEKLTSMQCSIDENNQLVAHASSKSFQNEEKIMHLSSRTSTIEQKFLNDRIEISGLPEGLINPNLNVKTQVLKLLKDSLIEIEPVEIANAYLMKKGNRENEKRTVCVVTFLHEAIKSRIMRRKMEQKTGPASKFYFNEVLTPANRKLVYSARQMKKAGTFSSVGTMNGQVFVKKTQDGAKIFINSQCEMEELGRMSNEKLTNNLQNINNQE